MQKNELTIRIGGELMNFSHPRIMAILNATPDSFYSRSRLLIEDEDACAESIGKAAWEKLEAGADILDVGGYSTRPGAPEVSPEEEWRRLRIALSGIRTLCGAEVAVSVDTFRADIAEKCVSEFNVQIINDIAGGTLDERMFQTVADLKVAYVLMHTRGNPQTMTGLTDYEDVSREVLSDLAFKADKLHTLGVADVILDPGFGFAKSVEGNFRLLDELPEFVKLGMPVLAGLSRKSMIWRTLGISPEESLNGTMALNMVALLKGADILRVHDVKEAQECVELFIKLQQKDA